MRQILILSLFAAACCAAPAAAQTLAEGYRSHERALPDRAHSVLVLDAQRTVYFTGDELVLDDARTRRVLLRTATQVFGSFTIRIDRLRLLFGETAIDGSGRVWEVPLHGAPRRLADIAFNYDAVLWSEHIALVSAKTRGFPAPDNDIMALDLRTGALDTVAVVSGASGPLAVDRAGSVYYATASPIIPTPPGTVDVVRYSAAQIAGALGPGHLTLADADRRYAGLDAAGRLALDDDGDLFVSVLFFGQSGVRNEIVEIDDIAAASPRAHRLLDLAPTPFAGGGLQFLPGNATAASSFEPFQPAGGGELVVHEPDFATGASQLRTITAARATTTITPHGTIPPGPFTIATDGGPAGGVGMLLLGAGHGEELALSVPGFEQRLFLAPMIAIPLPAAFDGSGRAARTLRNPGPIVPIELRTQTLFVDAGRRVLGSAAPLAFVLR
jgi:hypothetical protein